MTLREMRERQEQILAQARAKLDEITDDMPEERAREIEAEYDRAMAEYDRLEERCKREEEHERRQRELQDRLERPDPRRDVILRDTRHEPEGDDKETPEQRHARAFRSYLRYGLADMPPEERQILREMRAQSTTDPAEGGYLVPQGFMAELVVALKMFGPMLDPGITRELVTSMGNQIDWPTMDDTANEGYLLAENAEAVEPNDLAFGQKQLDAYKYASGPIKVSAELLQDSAVDVEAVVRDAMAERIGRIVNRHLTVGTGVDQPNGIVTASTLGFTAASATAITFDDLIELQHSVDPAYRSLPNVRWMFNDGTLKLLRKIKDADDNYIWQPANVQTGAPATILGFGYTVNQAMPNVATGQRSVVFGAFDRYIVRRVREFLVRRLAERYAEFDQVAFLGFARFDGELLDTGAVKHLAHP